MSRIKDIPLDQLELDDITPKEKIGNMILFVIYGISFLIALIRLIGRFSKKRALISKTHIMSAICIQMTLLFR